MRAASGRRFVVGWASTVAATAGVLILAALPPFVGPGLAAALHDAFAPFCHQLPGRSLHVGGVSLAVCHRCLGIYAALPVGALALYAGAGAPAFLHRWAGPLLALAVLVPGADWLAGLLGVYANTPVSRGLTGAVFGLVAGLYLARALALPPRLAYRPSAITTSAGK